MVKRTKKQLAIRATADDEVKPDVIDILKDFLTDASDGTKKFVETKIKTPAKRAIQKSRTKLNQRRIKIKDAFAGVKQRTKDSTKKIKEDVMHSIASHPAVVKMVDSLMDSRLDDLQRISNSHPAPLFEEPKEGSMRSRRNSVNSSPSDEEDEEESDTCRVYVDMVGDMFHYGHMQALRRARQAAEETGKKVHMIVGLCSDEDVMSYKRKPILSLEERCKAVMGCRYVDEVLPACPMQLDDETIDKYNINLVVHGDDYTPEQLYHYYKVPIDRGLFETVPYTPSISTTDIIKRCMAAGTVAKREAVESTAKEAANIGKNVKATNKGSNKTKKSSGIDGGAASKKAAKGKGKK